MVMVTDVGPAARPELWDGHAEWALQPDGTLVAWRLPAADLRVSRADELSRSAQVPAGVRLTVATDATALTLSGSTDELSSLDVTIDGSLVHRVPASAAGVSTSVALPAGLKELELWLPQRGQFALGSVALEGASVVREVDRPTRWITYGSSITQCKAAEGPTETWPAIVARQHGWNLRALGFGRQCHLDPVVSRFIRDSDADLISLCIGINIWGQSTFARRTFGAAVSGFVQTVRDGHPQTPIVVINPIAAPPREGMNNLHGLTLDDMRTEISAVVGALAAAGDSNITLIDGLDILGRADADLISDGTHPTAQGYRVMAERLAPRLGAAVSAVGGAR